MTGCPANLPLTHAPGQQHDTPFQAVVVEAHHCHQPQAFYAQLRQQGLTAIHFIPQQAGARRVTGVWLKVGAFSCVEASALTFCFELVCRGTLAEGCELHIAEQQAECWCDRCQQYVHLVSQHVRRCPHCNNDQLQIVADDGLQIQRLELE